MSASNTSIRNPSEFRPAISVLMTVYNGMPYLCDSVDSILNQDFPDFQFVIVDDGSDDETRAYLESLTDDRIEVVRQENQGTAAAANHGLSHCAGEFIARMDADDIALPARLKTQLEYLRSHPKVGIVGGQVAPMGDRRVGGSINLPCDHQAIFHALMSGLHGMAHSSIMIRSELLKDLDGYWAYPLIDDWDMMLRMGEISELHNIDEVLLHYRVHAGSLNGASMKRMHLHISFAIARARCRQAGQPMVEFEEFLVLQQQRPSWQKLMESAHIHALAQYRLAVAEIQSNHRIRGYARLFWAAVCSPARTVNRLGRIFGKRKSPDQSMSQATEQYRQAKSA